MGAELLLILDNAENSFFYQKRDRESYWLRINDGKEDGKWMVDRKGYTKPTSWTEATYLQPFGTSENDDLRNSVVLMTNDGSWAIVDKYHKSDFVCQKDAQVTKSGMGQKILGQPLGLWFEVQPLEVTETSVRPQKGLAN